MSNPSRTTYRVHGLLAVLAGIGLNARAIGWALADDGHVGGRAASTAILGLQAALVLVGLGLLWAGPPARRRGPWRAGAALLGVAALAGLAASAGARFAPRSAEESALARIDRLEEFLLRLQARLPTTLDRGASNLALPGPRGRALFAERVRVNDVGAAAVGEMENAAAGALGVERWTWSVTEPREVPRDELALWSGLFGELDHFEHGAFRIDHGAFASDDPGTYLAEMSFAGHARRADGVRSTIRAKLRARWRGTPGSADGWVVDAFETLSVSELRARELLFEDVTERLLPGRDDRERARRSIHEELVVDWLTDEGFEAPHPYFSHSAFDRQPGLSVVDIDADGFDDLYVMERWGRNLLLRNEGGAGFRDVAPELGLDLDGHCSSAIFADFDNDGDSDVLVGRTLRPSALYSNEGGVFRDRSAAVEGGLPYLASSVSAADYDLDGMLDAYVTTYGARLLLHPRLGPGAREAYLAPADRAEMERRIPESRRMAARVGPPNALIHNLGDGRFAHAREHPAVRVWRNTYQGAWSDYDADGDPDLYCANDFSVNSFVRNEGDGFTDVTVETRTTDSGFGMGATFGDYDNDLDPDLYVTNMYSRAGKRVAGLLGDGGAQIYDWARGNSLFESVGDGFERREEGAFADVEYAGWSWGSQFVDVDNDGYLDLYALSGFYTAPDEVSIPYDT